MVAEPQGLITRRVKSIAAAFDDAGFTTTVSTDADAWLIAHAAFVVPIAFALYRIDVDPKRLSTDVATLRLMVRATREAFRALSARGHNQIPRNLVPYIFTRPSVSPSHTGAAPWPRPEVSCGLRPTPRVARQEITSLAAVLEDAVERTGRPAKNLAALLRAP